METPDPGHGLGAGQPHDGFDLAIKVKFGRKLGRRLCLLFHYLMISEKFKQKPQGFCLNF